MRMATVLTDWKPIQRNRIRQDSRGSAGVRGPGMYVEKRARTWETLISLHSKSSWIYRRTFRLRELTHIREYSEKLLFIRKYNLQQVFAIDHKGRLKGIRESDWWIVLWGRESRLRGKGTSGNTQPVKETHTGHAGSDNMCKPQDRE